jgi:hypothetical protein
VVCAAAGELALSRGQLDLAHDCLEKAKDMSGLLLLSAAKVRGCCQDAAPVMHSQSVWLFPAAARVLLAAKHAY